MLRGKEFAFIHGPVVLVLFAAVVGSSALVPLGVVLLIIGLMLEAGATGAVKAIKVSAKLLAGRSPEAPGEPASSGSDGAQDT